MNLAIILAVSNYQNASCLPGCILDAQLMKTLLDKTQKYNEVLLIEQNTDSLKVKEEISNLISNNKGKVFDEVFFYYTGHGDFREDEFYYILSDFDKNRYRQTTLANSELDNLLRQLSPGLTIKIIDACHSGVTYIKDKDTVSKHLNESKNHFKNCYFMFSSMSDQSSYQDNIISHFTKSFIHSVLNYESTNIRYKHIIDHISDDFEKNSRQKPLFIIQAGCTEIFCSIDQELKALLSKKIDLFLGNKSETSDIKTPSLLDLVKNDAERYCSQEEVMETLNAIKNFIEDYSYSSELMSLYKISTKFENDNKSISNQIVPIGKWLESNENNYFAKISYRQEQITNNNESSLFSPDTIKILSRFSGDTYNNYKNVVSGFELTTDSPYKLIEISANPEYCSLDLCGGKIAFIFSRVNIRFFYSYSNFKLDNWDSYSHDSSSKWQTIEVEMKKNEKLKETIHNILSEFDSFVLDPIRAKYISTTESQLEKED